MAEYKKEGIGLKPESGTKVDIFGMRYSILATARQTNGQYGLVEAIASKEANSPHIHSKEDEAFYVLSGELEFRIGDQIITGTSGTFIHAPKGIAHTFRSTSEEPAKLLIWVFPGGFERFFREIDGTTSANKVMAIAKKYGLKYP